MHVIIATLSFMVRIIFPYIHVRNSFVSQFLLRTYIHCQIWIVLFGVPVYMSHGLYCVVCYPGEAAIYY